MDPGGLEALGCEVSLEAGLGPQTLPEALGRIGPEILIVRSTKVPASVIERAATLKGIIRAGAGTDNIDAEAAGSRGIAVCNCPGMNAVAVAELAIGHLICCDRRIPAQTGDLARGIWNKKKYASARGLKDSTLGVVGVGAVGRAVVTRALAFEMDVIAWDLPMDEPLARLLGVSSGGNTRDSLLEMVSRCDALTIHVALTDQTRGMCDDEFFGAMRDGAYFINTARGPIVDEAALERAIRQKNIRAGLDVYQGQPGTPEGSFDCALAKIDGVSCTHHVGASTAQAQRAVGEEAVRIVAQYIKTGRFINCVNEGLIR